MCMCPWYETTTLYIDMYVLHASSPLPSTQTGIP